jgi:hypothetical protein
MNIQQQFEATVDNIFEANNFKQEGNLASKKIEKLAGEPGTKERIEKYRRMVENGIPLFEGEGIEL